MNSENDDAASRIKQRSINKIKQLEDLCSSDDLSIDELRKITYGIISDNLYNSSFLHRACLNKNVTLEIVNYLLDLYPQALHCGMSMKIEEETATTTYGATVTTSPAHPLTLACYNKDCPNEVIQLLIATCGCNDYFLKHICYMNYDWANTGIVLNEDDVFGGTPLHYYLSRTTNVDLNIVKELVNENAELIVSADENSKCTPIHVLMHNESIGDMYDVVEYLVESNPDSLLRKDAYIQTPLNVACHNGHMTARTIELLLRVCPDSIHQPSICSWFPIHTLCKKHEENETQIDDEVAMDILKLLLDAQPDLVTRVSTLEDGGELPLHKAATNKSPSFCKMLIDAYPESLRTADGYGSLPFHHACKNGRPDTLEYLLKVYPESLHVRNDASYLPIHCAADSPGDNTADIVNVLLRHDPDCVSKWLTYTDQSGSRHEGALPLHIVCLRCDESNVTEFLFDLYPEAILIQNGMGKLPADLMREKLASRNLYNETYAERMQDVDVFLSTQEMYAYKAQDENATRTPDFTGSLPLHNALYASAPLGAIKLLVKGYQDAINVPDGSGRYPLDTACWCCAVGVVRYLAELLPDRLNACDMNKNFPLHHACRGGSCEVISYLLGTLASASVSERNVDGKLPIHLFCEYVNEQDEEGKDTPEYTETIWLLLTAYPETVLNW